MSFIIYLHAARVNSQLPPIASLNVLQKNSAQIMGANPCVASKNKHQAAAAAAYVVRKTAPISTVPHASSIFFARACLHSKHANPTSWPTDTAPPKTSHPPATSAKASRASRSPPHPPLSPPRNPPKAKAARVAFANGPRRALLPKKCTTKESRRRCTAGISCRRRFSRGHRPRT